MHQSIECRMLPIIEFFPFQCLVLIICIYQFVFYLAPGGLVSSTCDTCTWCLVQSPEEA